MNNMIPTFAFSINPPMPMASQLNWISGTYERAPEQLDLDLPLDDPDLTLPPDQTVTLLATENGAQLIVAGYGLYVGKKSERIVIRHDKKVCAQVPLMRLQELVIAGRGVSISSDLIEELCSRGIRIAFLNNTGKPTGLLTSPLLTATVATRRAQFAATGNAFGGGTGGPDCCREVTESGQAAALFREVPDG